MSLAQLDSSFWEAVALAVLLGAVDMAVFGLGKGIGLMWNMLGPCPVYTSPDFVLIYEMADLLNTHWQQTNCHTLVADADYTMWLLDVGPVADNMAGDCAEQLTDRYDIHSQARMACDYVDYTDLNMLTSVRNLTDNTTILGNAFSSNNSTN